MPDKSVQTIRDLIFYPCIKVPRLSEAAYTRYPCFKAAATKA